jgi:uncharacterized protein (UPF0371 family)
LEAGCRRAARNLFLIGFRNDDRYGTAFARSIKDHRTAPACAGDFRSGNVIGGRGALPGEADEAVVSRLDRGRHDVGGVLRDGLGMS